MSRPVDLLRDTLAGHRLIEASAGTGKTWTLALLYVRLVLGHDPAFVAATGVARRPLSPPEILVVTFTDAATQELRDRIRSRLAQAARLWRGEDEAAPAGDALRALRDSMDPQDWPAGARRLELAAEWMDEAAVSTIHGWCRRMLSEHAFDSGSLFSLQLQKDLSDLQDEAVRDYWRTFYVPLPLPLAEQVVPYWSHPQALGLALCKLLSLDGLDGLDADSAPQPPQALLLQAQHDRLAALQALKQPWRDSDGVTGLAALLEQGYAGQGPWRLKKASFRTRAQWCDDLQTWLDTPEQEAPWKPKVTAWKTLTPEGMAEKTDSGTPPNHPALDAIAALPAQLAQLPQPRLALLRHALFWVRQRLGEEQDRRAWMGFDGLLTRLDAALQGPGGPRLAQRIRDQFPVALIDEFQDTDPIQYRLFSTVYPFAPEQVGPTPSAENPISLFLIGDPKQAIYAFRGADIYTYWQARRDAAGRVATLGTNFRSTQAMVSAVNAVFETASQRLGGALFLPGAPADEPAPVPFEPVAAQGLSERFVRGAGSVPALTLWVPQADGAALPTNNDALREQVSRACAAQVLHLLHDEGCGFVTEGEAGTGAAPVFRRLQPADCALLVNTGKEAKALRLALSERGLRSVYVSDKSSVYHSPEAEDLQRVLQACAEPDSSRHVRAALACRTLGLGWADLEVLQHSDSAWSARLEQFQSYRHLWRRQGVLPLVRHLLADFGVPQRLLAAGDERALTNWLHLAELLQQASALLEGEHALVRYLIERRQKDDSADGDTDGDEQRLRLEGDAGLIQIVTVHKSKGLEYPLVWLPFAGQSRPVKAQDLPVKWHDDQGQLHHDLEPDAAALAQAENERLGEDVRKLYVALTRARHATWLAMLGSGFDTSALSWVSGLKAPAPPSKGQAPQDAGAPAWHEQAQAWADQMAQKAAASGRVLPGGALAVVPLPDPDALVGASRFRAQREQITLCPPLQARVRREVPWRFVSYSGLRRQEGGANAGEAPANAAHERLQDPGLWPDDPGAGGQHLHELPAGPQAGTLMHGLLEWAMGAGRAQRDAPGVLADQVARRCAVRGWAAWIPALTDSLEQWLSTPLPWPVDPFGTETEPAPLALRDLTRVQVEMEFWLPVHRVDLRQLDALVCAHTLQGWPRPALEPGEINGLFKGYIDLVADLGEDAGGRSRYVVLDYKSNRLGEAASDYSAETLSQAVAAHRYDLQGVMYLYALHRLLSVRLPGYDYDRHVAGVGCLFLRGIHGPVQGLHMERPPRALMVALDALFGAATQADAEAEPQGVSS